MYRGFLISWKKSLEFKAASRNSKEFQETLLELWETPWKFKELQKKTIQPTPRNLSNDSNLKKSMFPFPPPFLRINGLEAPTMPRPLENLI